MNQILFSFALAVLLSGYPNSVSAQTAAPGLTRELTLDELVRMAPEWNLSVRRAEQTLREAEVGLAERPGWDASSLALSGGYRSSTDAPWTAGSSISVQPVPQLSLGASSSFALGGEGDPRSEEELSAEVRPLEPGRSTWREDRNYRSASVRLEDQRQSVARSVEIAVLRLMVQRSRVGLAARVRDLRREEYEIELRRQNLGSASFQDVQDRQVQLIDARRAFFGAQQQLLRDEAAVARIVALADTEVTVAPIALDELRGHVEQRRAAVATLDTANGRSGEGDRRAAASAVTTALLLAEIELAGAETELRELPRVAPDLSITGAVTIPNDERDSTTTAGITLRLSPSQWRDTDRTRLTEEIALLRLEVAAERYSANLEQELALQNIAIVEDALAVAELQLTRDRTAAREAELLVAQGSRTLLELEQLEINVVRAEIAVYEAAADVYTTMGAYLDLLR